MNKPASKTPMQDALRRSMSMRAFVVENVKGLGFLADPGTGNLSAHPSASAALDSFAPSAILPADWPESATKAGARFPWAGRRTIHGERTV